MAGSIYLDSGLSLDAVWRVYYRFNLKNTLISHLKLWIWNRMMREEIDQFSSHVPKSPIRYWSWVNCFFTLYICLGNQVLFLSWVISVAHAKFVQGIAWAWTRDYQIWLFIRLILFICFSVFHTYFPQGIAWTWTRDCQVWQTRKAGGWKEGEG